MSEFWKAAYSTEVTSARTICCDAADHDCSGIYEHKGSNAESRKGRSFSFDGYDKTA